MHFLSGCLVYVPAREKFLGFALAEESAADDEEEAEVVASLLIACESGKKMVFRKEISSQ